MKKKKYTINWFKSIGMMILIYITLLILGTNNVLVPTSFDYKFLTEFTILIMIALSTEVYYE